MRAAHRRHIGFFTIFSVYKSLNIGWSNIVKFITSLMALNELRNHFQNKQINRGLKHLPKWFNTNKISVDISKTEPVLFNRREKHLDHELKIKLHGKKLYQTDPLEYL